MDWLRRVFAGRRDKEGGGFFGTASPAGTRGSAEGHHIREADRLRDAGCYAEAAEAYGAALVIAPLRTDIRVQYGNMLKDSGRPEEAEEAYRCALSQTPDDPDLYLQLGHALKLQGKRTEALAAYRRSAELQPHATEPISELFAAGAPEAQEASFVRQLAQGGVEAIMAMTEEIARLQEAVKRLASALPDLQAQTAFPLASYDRLRRIYDVPPAPSVGVAYRLAVILPARCTPLEVLHAQIAALIAQTCQNWRLCVIGGDADCRQMAERAAASDPRILWIEAGPAEHTAAAERRAALSAAADWLVFLAKGALLHPRAIEWFAAVSARGTAKAYITDEETVSRVNGLTFRSAPVLRQAVDYDTLLEANPFGDTVAVDRATYAAIAGDLVVSSLAAARASLLLSLADRSEVGHISLPLIGRSPESGESQGPPGAHEAAVRAHLALAGDRRPAIVEPPSDPAAPLTVHWQPRDPRAKLLVVIPTRDNGSDLGNFVESLRRRAELPQALQILIVDNRSRDRETLRLLGALAEQPWAKVLAVDEPFNWARFNNQAVPASDAPLLLFANDDMVMLSDGWDRRLRGLLARPEIGAVGARLLYPDDTIQHAGILLGWRGADIHDGRYEPLTRSGPCQRWHASRAVSAVTGAFLAIRREVFTAAGGFDEIGLPVGYSDIDLALKLRARGLKILWTPQITLRHFESKTRGLDHLDPEKHARNAVEQRIIADRWGSAMQSDPSLNPNWHQATLPFRLLSAPSEARLWRHIRLCAAANPWLPLTGAQDAPVGSEGSPERQTQFGSAVS